MPFKDAQKQRAAANRWGRERSQHDRDIAPDYPGPGDLAGRGACARDLRRFYDRYFPNAFNLPWSDDHIRVIGRLEAVVLEGGLFALAMPRGSGKSTLSVRAALWALLYGHRRFVCLVGASEDHAKQLLKHFKAELTFNEALIRDFRQVCYPLVRLENNGRRVAGQLFDGQQTRIEWAADRLTFPTMPDSACDGPNVSGSTVSVAGVTGALRGQSSTLASGVIIRPELVILDDPQTRESAGSPKQSADRAAVIQGDVLGMAGPGKTIAAVMPCTVIRPDDLASRFLDRKQHPEWSGQRTRMVYAFPADEKLWEEYNRIRVEGLESERGTGAATEFYAANRAAMDAGAVVAWPARFEPGEISALQSAMNLKFRDEAAFWAEYQNDPLPDRPRRADDLTADLVAAKLNRLPRGAVPAGCNRLTAFVDVQQAVLYWLVAGWEDDFTGYVLDYGAYPDQKRGYFAAADARNTLARSHPGLGLEGQLYAGLEALTTRLLARDWPRDDGAALRVERLLIDANWARSTDVVRKFCRQGPFSALLTPSHGQGVTAGRLPMADWPKRPGERAGHHWRLRGPQDTAGVRSAVFDTNYWKSFVHARLATAMGDRGCLSLFGDRPDLHRMLADHLVAETREETTGRGRVVDEWRLTAGRENHWLDCLVGCAVAASIQGCALRETAAAPAPARRRRLTMAEMRERGRKGASWPSAG